MIWKNHKRKWVNKNPNQNLLFFLLLLLKENAEAWSSPYCPFRTLDNWEICNFKYIEYFFLKFLDRDITVTKNNRNYCNSLKNPHGVYCCFLGKQRTNWSLLLYKICLLSLWTSEKKNPSEHLRKITF